LFEQRYFLLPNTDQRSRDPRFLGRFNQVQNLFVLEPHRVKLEGERGKVGKVSGRLFGLNVALDLPLLP